VCPVCKAEVVRGSLVRIFGSSQTESPKDGETKDGDDKWWTEWLKDAPRRRDGPSFNNTHPDNLDGNAVPGFGFGNVGIAGTGPLLALLLPLLFGIPIFAFGGNVFGGGGGGGGMRFGGGGAGPNRPTSPLTFILLVVGALFVLEVIFSSGHYEYYDEF